MKNITKLAGLALLVGGCSNSHEQSRPNVILVMSDDQGIGNLSCLGNPYIETPAIDRHFAKSVRLTDFHVCPLSTPTRSSIITGQYPIRNGAWATFKGRDVISGDSKTIAEVFRDGGYSTAMFGKWHLGDNYPARATDKGFEYVVQHCSGGVGELSDHWGNNYFDDTYLVNNKPKKFKGFCTDVWFDEAMKYIKGKKNSDKPFFVYLATNAPHSPHIAPEEYTKRYTDIAKKRIIMDAGYYGQIANLDDNFARLTEMLERNGMIENTILIFTTDNGAPPANNPCTLGFRGGKSSPLEGGHRVPFFIRWDGGGIGGGVDVDGLSTHVDLIPTLASMCGIEIHDKFDGIDISAAIAQKEEMPNERSVFIHHRQSQEQPFDEKGSVVMHDNWRLINGKQLYDLNSDPEQKINVANKFPDITKRLQSENKAFIAETKQMDNYKEFVPMAVVGSDKQSVVELTIQHAMGSDMGLWKQPQIAEGIKNTNSLHLIGVERSGEYTISLTRWKRDCSAPIWGVPADQTKAKLNYKAITPSSATLAVKPYGDTKGESSKQSYKIKAGDEAATFKVKLNKGEYMLDAQFIDEKGNFGAYYIYIE